MTDGALAHGLWGVLSTPFHPADLAVDEQSLAAQVRYQRAAGARGVVALGVFGESARLTPAERLRVVETVAASAGEMPIVVGLAELTTESAVLAAKELLAAAPGLVCALMVQANSADPHELADHLVAVHRATDVGIVVQDYPVASGVEIAGSHLADAIAGLDFVAAVKSEAPPTSAAIAGLTARGDVPVFGGLGGIGLLDELMAGAAGAMTGFSFPGVLAQTVQAWEVGGYESARATFLPWLPLVNFEAQLQIGLAIRKRSLQERGIIAGAAVRPPGRPMPEALLPVLRQHLAAVPQDPTQPVNEERFG